MQTVLGFLFDFKSNAGKAFKKVRDEITKTTQGWIKNNRNLRKAMKVMNLEFNAARGTLKNWIKDLKASVPTVGAVIDQIGEKFGGVAGVIADTLLRPGALVAAAAGIAVNAGKSMETTMVGIRRETALTEEELAKYGNKIVDIASAMGAPLSQVQGIAKAYAAANVPLEDFSGLMRTVISVNRLTGRDTREIAQEMLNMSKQLKMSGTDMARFWNVAHGAAKASKASIDELSNSISMVSDVVSRNLPDKMREGVEAAVKMKAVLMETFDSGGADNFISGFFEGALDIESSKFGQLRTIVAAGGAEIAAIFQEAIQKGDMSSAFMALQKAIQNIDTTQLYKMKDTFTNVFGMDPKSMRLLKEIPTTLMSTVSQMAELSVKSDTIYEQTKNLKTMTERWHVLWSRIETALLPFGEILVGIFGKVFTILSDILGPVAAFVNSLGTAGQYALMLGVALATAHVWMGPIASLAHIIGGGLLTAWGNAAGLVKSLGNGNFAAAALTTTFAALGKAVAFVRAMTFSLAGAVRVLGVAGLFLKAAFFEIFLPIAAIVAVVSLLNLAMKKAFGVGLLDVFGKALEFIGWVIGGIVDSIAWILKAITYVLTLGQVDLWATPDTKKADPAKKGKDAMAELDGASMFTPAEMPSRDFSALAAAPQQTPEEVRKSFGTDDIIRAFFDVGHMIVQAVKSSAGAPGSLLTPAASISNPNRHSPITNPMRDGPR